VSKASGQRHGGSDRGALILSYVIIVPVFLAALMVIVQAALWYLARDAALAAARQGADAARVLHAPPGAGPTAALAFARSAASGYLLQPRATPFGSTPGTVRITVTGRVPGLIPGLPITVSQAAQAPVEKFTTP
jgi:Flp pilus assembly protein TadG